jgi:hypothetical protein
VNVAYSIENKPTLRNYGDMMYNMMVMHAVGLEEIAWTIWHDFNNVISKESRKDILGKVAENLSFGYSLNDGSWDGVLDEEVEEATKVAKKLFPELINHEKETTRT